MAPPVTRKRATKSARLLRDVLRGVAIAWSGLRTWGTSRRLMAWGLVPGAITLVVFGAGLLIVVSQLSRWSGAIANALVDSTGWLHTLVQLLAALAIMAGAVVFAFYAFAALTLTVGQGVFERISRTVDERHGFLGVEHKEQWCRSLVRSVGEVARLGLLTIPLAVALFVVGFVPIVGGLVSFVLGVAVGGWFLALELTTYPLERRGTITLAQRRAVLGQQRAVVVGFGATVFLMFLIPLGPALFMPAAVAGATRLVHETAGTGPHIS